MSSVAPPSTPKDQILTTDRRPHTIGLKSLFKLINERSPRGREARRYFENTKPKIQCEKVLEGKGKDICWLCGLRIVGVTPQCEHILPFPQGAVFLDIYSSKYGTEITPALQLEYGYAHPFCNASKNDQVFITGDETGYYPDQDQIIKCLDRIHDVKYPSMNLETQYDYVTGRIFEICDFVNKTLEITPDNSHAFRIIQKNLILHFRNRARQVAADLEAAATSNPTPNPIKRPLSGDPTALDGSRQSKRSKLSGGKRTKARKTQRKKHTR